MDLAGSEEEEECLSCGRSQPMWGKAHAGQAKRLHEVRQEEAACMGVATGTTEMCK